MSIQRGVGHAAIGRAGRIVFRVLPLDLIAPRIIRLFSGVCS